MKILGIETSCDETAASVIEVSQDKSYVKVLSSVTATSLALHAKTGGIIPEVAARNQIKDIIPVIYETLTLADGVWPMANSKESHNLLAPAIDAIAVTYGPGLIGSLLVGVETAKTLAYVWDKPLIPINHLFGHMYANLVEVDNPPEFPVISLIVSGGHTDLVLMKSHTDITWLGGTRDDAAGECFDKCARLIGYAYPGGPKIAELALKGDPKAVAFPRPMISNHNFEFSFSGLKTAFLNKTKESFAILRTSSEKIGWNQIILEEHITEIQKKILYDLCASLQEAIVSVLVKKTFSAVDKYHAKSLILSGGVAANEKLRETFRQNASAHGVKFFVPEKFLCTDNGTMIATAALFQGKKTDWQEVVANPELYFD